MAEAESGIMLTVAVLGGTGKEGSGLAVRWALNGYRVLIGSRDAAKAIEKCAELNRELGGEYLTGVQNAAAAQVADIIVVSVPYSAQIDTIEGVRDYLSGKIVVDVTVPLAPPDIRTVHVPEGGSAVLNAQKLLGSDVRLVGAFQNVSAEKLRNPDTEVDCDVLVCSDHDDAKAEVIKLVEAAGMRGIDAGPLANSAAAEALTPVLLYINKAYKVKGSGIRITGIPS
ncbi:MAG: NADPH-dependent F420 reductase [Chloroflexi bacterium]|nr:NADPH-dependent F420 reductase [Chloroflexota bacterium]